jgi:hypothetical protein
MTNAERQARYKAKKLAEYMAANPLPEWMAGALKLDELGAGALKLDDELAAIDDPRLRAELLAEAAAAEAAAEVVGEFDHDQGTENKTDLVPPLEPSLISLAISPISFVRQTPQIRVSSCRRAHQ